MCEGRWSNFTVMAEEVWHKAREKSRLLDRHHLCFVYKVILKVVVDFEMSAQPVCSRLLLEKGLESETDIKF